MNTRMRQALIRDLGRLHAEIPELVAAIESGDEVKTEEAMILLTRGSAGRFQLLMDRLTSMVVAEAMKGNKEPLRMIASGEAFDRY